MPHFQPRRTQPPRPDTYRRLARLVRGLADKIEANAEQQDDAAKKTLTEALDALNGIVRDLWRRHHEKSKP